MTQLSVGLALDLGKNTLVLAFNSPVSVPTPNYEVRIAPALINAGVKRLANGKKVKFPGNAMVAALVLVDDEFQMVRVVAPTKANITAASLDMKPLDEAAMAKFGEFLKTVPDDSLTADLVSRLFAINPAPLRALMADLKAQMSGVDLEAVVKELTRLAQQYEASLPDSAVSEED